MSDQESSDRLEAQALDSVNGSADEVSSDAASPDEEQPADAVPAVASATDEADEVADDKTDDEASAPDESPPDESPPEVVEDDEARTDRADREGQELTGSGEPADSARSSRPLTQGQTGQRKGRGQDAPVFYVAGFWHRWVAAAIDLAIIVPVVLLLYTATSWLGDVALPASRHYGVDFWLDLLLEGDPALIALVALLVAVATIYVLVFQIALSHTPGMRVMKIRIVDQYGASPSTARSAARSAGYVASAATLGLGFIWIGFDSEKRGLHDWLSGTYVVRV